jgi:hypothetical protein
MRESAKWAACPNGCTFVAAGCVRACDAATGNQSRYAPYLDREPFGQPLPCRRQERTLIKVCAPDPAAQQRSEGDGPTLLPCVCSANLTHTLSIPSINLLPQAAARIGRMTHTGRVFMQGARGLLSVWAEDRTRRDRTNTGRRAAGRGKADGQESQIRQRSMAQRAAAVRVVTSSLL